MTVYVVDEDLAAYEPWAVELDYRGFVVRSIGNADDAYEELVQVPEGRIELVLIDVMLATRRAEESRFSVERTDLYLETGLRLLEDLSDHRPNAFPLRGALLTNTSNATTFAAAVRTSKAFSVPLWLKGEIASPMDFGDRVDAHIRHISRSKARLL